MLLTSDRGHFDLAGRASSIVGENCRNGEVCILSFRGATAATATVTATVTAGTSE